MKMEGMKIKKEPLLSSCTHRNGQVIAGQTAECLHVPSTHRCSHDHYYIVLLNSHEPMWQGLVSFTGDRGET
jgi:hypothetical protein